MLIQEWARCDTLTKFFLSPCRSAKHILSWLSINNVISKCLCMCVFVLVCLPIVYCFSLASGLLLCMKEKILEFTFDLVCFTFSRVCLVAMQTVRQGKVHSLRRAVVRIVQKPKILHTQLIMCTKYGSCPQMGCYPGLEPHVLGCTICFPDRIWKYMYDPIQLYPCRIGALLTIWFCQVIYGLNWLAS